LVSFGTPTTILYSVEAKTNIFRVIKRSISSVIARIYDPLGLLVPVIIRAKILRQRVWALKANWDESLPSDLHSEWNRYYSQLPLLNDIRLPRKTIIKAAVNIEIHGFCDTSEKAYGACVYFRTINADGLIQTLLFTQWIKSSPHTLKTFVANRVSEIQTKINIADWRYVPTIDNPADLISQGQTPKEFLHLIILENQIRVA
jgi:hypothetical protein